MARFGCRCGGIDSDKLWISLERLPTWRSRADAQQTRRHIRRRSNLATRDGDSASASRETANRFEYALDASRGGIRLVNRGRQDDRCRMDPHASTGTNAGASSCGLNDAPFARSGKRAYVGQPPARVGELSDRCVAAPAPKPKERIAAKSVPSPPLPVALASRGRFARRKSAVPFAVPERCRTVGDLTSLGIR